MPKTAAKAAEGPTSIPIPAHQAVATQVLLPAGTNKVGMKSGAAAFTCTNLQLVTQKGRNAADQYFAPVDPINIPARMDSTQSHTTPGDPYVLVYIRCHGGAADSRLVITPSP